MNDVSKTFVYEIFQLITLGIGSYVGVCLLLYIKDHTIRRIVKYTIEYQKHHALTGDRLDAFNILISDHTVEFIAFSLFDLVPCIVTFFTGDRYFTPESGNSFHAVPIKKMNKEIDEIILKLEVRKALLQKEAQKKEKEKEESIDERRKRKLAYIQERKKTEEETFRTYKSMIDNVKNEIQSLRSEISHVLKQEKVDIKTDIIVNDDDDNKKYKEVNIDTSEKYIETRCDSCAQKLTISLDNRTLQKCICKKNTYFCNGACKTAHINNNITSHSYACQQYY